MNENVEWWIYSGKWLRKELLTELTKYLQYIDDDPQGPDVTGEVIFL